VLPAHFTGEGAANANHRATLYAALDDARKRNPLVLMVERLHEEVPPGATITPPDLGSLKIDGSKITTSYQDPLVLIHAQWHLIIERTHRAEQNRATNDRSQPTEPTDEILSFHPPQITCIGGMAPTNR
jgi:hypothetical protein